MKGRRAFFVGSGFSRMCVSNTALPAHNVPILHQRRFDKLWVGVKELAVLSLALASQKIATNLDILLLLTHSRQLHLLQRVAVAWRYASFPSNVSTFQCVHETALFPAGTRSVAEIATSVWQFHHRRFFTWRALTRGLLH